VKDARNGRGLKDAVVRIVGTNRRVIARNGFFTFNGVPRGRVTLKFSKNGFIDGQQKLSVRSNINNGGAGDINMSPRMSTSQWRASSFRWGSSQS
jgi:hypothetical protein